MAISIKKYAEMRGICDVEVREAIKSGRISCNDDGTIDREQADMDWFLNADHEKENGWRLILGSEWAERDEEDTQFILNAYWSAFAPPPDKDPWIVWAEETSVVIADELGIKKDTLQSLLRRHMAERLSQM